MSQTWFAKAAPYAPEAASVLFTASVQATIACGALVGGAVLHRTSVSTVMPLGGRVSVLTVLAVAARPLRHAEATAHDPPSRRAPP